ncbi:MAG: hypothetical protein U0556_09825 [Dehalococcoidia bacterium]
MLVIDFYGNRKTWPDEGVPPWGRVEPYRGVMPARAWKATIVAAVETLMQLAPVVRFADKRAVRAETVAVVHLNPGVLATPAVVSDTDDSRYPRGQRHTIQAAENGLALGGGSKIVDGNAVDVLLLTGDLDFVPIVSDAWRTGLYSSDVALSPIWELRPVGFGEPTLPPAPTLPSAPSLPESASGHVDAILTHAAALKGLIR